MLPEKPKKLRFNSHQEWWDNHVKEQSAYNESTDPNKVALEWTDEDDYWNEVRCEAQASEQKRLDSARLRKLVTEGGGGTKARGAKNRGIGALARSCIMKGWNFELTRAEIVKEIPTSKFSRACYSWYRGKLKKAGVKI